MFDICEFVPGCVAPWKVKRCGGLLPAVFPKANPPTVEFDPKVGAGVEFIPKAKPPEEVALFAFPSVFEPKKLKLGCCCCDGVACKLAPWVELLAGVDGNSTLLKSCGVDWLVAATSGRLNCSPEGLLSKLFGVPKGLAVATLPPNGLAVVVLLLKGLGG